LASTLKRTSTLSLAKAGFEYLKDRVMPKIEVYLKKECQLMSSHANVPLEKAF
jgi:hypothetical protein